MLEASDVSFVPKQDICAAHMENVSPAVTAAQFGSISVNRLTFHVIPF